MLSYSASLGSGFSIVPPSGMASFLYILGSGASPTTVTRDLVAQAGTLLTLSVFFDSAATAATLNAVLGSVVVTSGLTGGAQAVVYNITQVTALGQSDSWSNISYVLPASGAQRLSISVSAANNGTIATYRMTPSRCNSLSATSNCQPTQKKPIHI